MQIWRENDVRSRAHSTRRSAREWAPNPTQQLGTNWLQRSPYKYNYITHTRAHARSHARTHARRGTERVCREWGPYWAYSIQVHIHLPTPPRHTHGTDYSSYTLRNSESSTKDSYEKLHVNGLRFLFLKNLLKPCTKILHAHVSPI